MAVKSDDSAAVDDREIVSSREFDAPRERVFEAFRDPGRLARWWGPDGFTNTIQEFDFQPGGRWRLVMRSSEGVEFDNQSVFEEIVPPARIVLRHLEPIHAFRMTMTFESLERRTCVTWRMLFDDVAECDRVRPLVTAANEQNFDRLSAVLAEQTDDRLVLELTRDFAAPRQLVYDAWTKQEHLAKWSIPSDIEIIDGDGDVRPGGRWHCRMKAPDGTALQLGGVYRDVVPGEKLVFTHAWQDGQGSPGCETVVTVLFSDNAAGGTRLDFRQEGFATAGSRDGHAAGWNECFDRLETWIAGQPASALNCS